jgi:sugar lactone lactonase YvrE
MCCLGGEDLRTLFVTSIMPADPALDTHGMSGAVIALQTEVAGQAEPRFSRFPATALQAQ